MVFYEQVPDPPRTPSETGATPEGNLPRRAPADPPADPPANVGLFGFGARPAAAPPRAREGPCEVCAEILSAHTRGRCGTWRSVRACLRRPDSPKANAKIEALLDQCRDKRPTMRTKVVPPDGNPFNASEYLRKISTNWRLLVDDDDVDGGYTFLTPRQMERLEAGPEWLRDDIQRWRTPPCTVCAEHPRKEMRRRCGALTSLRGCLRRPESQTTDATP